ncbi:MAG: hypothetical protein D6815_05665 [Candidatus Dadabacteria bacterium]|nr:MAG: hypothetical protein D6815_05665 [Candidatus Dadabacteria bacterium]
MCRRLGIDEADVTRRLEFLEFGERDAHRLAELRGLFEEISGEPVDGFYRHLRQFPETAAFLADEDLVAKLGEVQRQHFLALACGRYDLDYVESRLRVGMAHARINLEPRWYVGAYAAQYRIVQGHLIRRFASEPECLVEYLEALAKIILFDISLAMDAYIFGGFVERSLAEAHVREARRATDALVERDRAEARREQLLSMVVHDIRSPVTAIMATARAGLRKFPDVGEAPGRQFSLIESSGAHLLQIIDNILTVARMPGGEIPVHREAFDVAQVVRSCVEQLSPFAQQTGHTVELDASQPVQAEALDKMLVRRIVANLLVNAFRHTPSGGHVSVSCGKRGESCVIEVADDGPGIPPRLADRLFGSSEDGPARSDGAYLDTGLGLPFCRLACEQLGGSIRLEPAERGARFVVELPCK